MIHKSQESLVNKAPVQGVLCSVFSRGKNNLRMCASKGIQAFCRVIRLFLTFLCFGGTLIIKTLAKVYGLVAYEAILLVYSIPLVGPVCGGLGLACWEVSSEWHHPVARILFSTAAAVLSVLGAWLFFMEGSVFSYCAHGIENISCVFSMWDSNGGRLSVIRVHFFFLLSFLPKLDPALTGLWPAVLKAADKLHFVLKEALSVVSAYVGIVSPVLSEVDMIFTSLSLLQWILVFCIVKMLWNFMQANISGLKGCSSTILKGFVQVCCTRVQEVRVKGLFHKVAERFLMEGTAPVSE